ncbi:MAG: hypothetical protein JXA77_00460 [Bacteroidales bacterium]|nr:hypothetical protein [Bacteroidales bacterium]MBN2817645.1 hypothetical protein [Bacteroidales bacterium]
MNKFFYAGVLITLGCVVFLNSCEDEPINLGANILPEADIKPAGADTFTVECYTLQGFPGTAIYPSSTTTTSETSTDNCPIGYVIDPIFGETSVNLTMELGFNSDNYYSHVDTCSDTYKNCKFYFKIDDDKIFGGENGFDVELYPLTKTISYSSTYNTEYALESDKFNFNLNVANSTTHKVFIDHYDIEGIDSGYYYLIVELDDDYAESLMDTTFIYANDLYSSAYDFHQKFPGFYIKSQPKNETGGIENFFYNDSKMVVEYERIYHFPKSEKNDSITTQYSTFAINKYQCFYKNESNNVPYGPFGTILNDTVNQGQNFYVQSLGGARGYLKIPELETFKTIRSDSLGINLAELVLPVNRELLDTTNFFVPGRLTIKGAAPGYPDGYSIEDDNISWGYFKGYFNDSTLEYRINLTEYVHQYLQDDDNQYRARFYLMAAVNNITSSSFREYKVPGRVVLNSGISDIKPAYLRVIYTNTTY